MAKATTPKAPSKAVATRTKGTDVAMPDFMKEDVGKGTENIGRDDIETPRLQLIQGTHTDLLSQYDELRAGMFFHSAAEQVFDVKKEPLRVVPVYVDKRYLLWNPLDSGGGILARADDGVHWQPANRTFDVTLDKKDGGAKVKWKTADTVQRSGLAAWGTQNPNDDQSPPAATLMYNFLLYFIDYPDLMPAVFSFQRSSISVARKFNSRLKTQRAPMFGLIYELGSGTAQNNSSQSYFVPTMKGAGFVEDTDIYAAVKEMNRQFTEAGLNIRDLESVQTEDQGSDDGEGEAEPEATKPTRGGASTKGRRAPSY